MSAGDLVAAAILAGALVGILWFVTSSVRSGKPDATLSREPRQVFVRGFVCVLALMAFGDMVGMTGTALPVLAAAFAVLVVVLGSVPELVAHMCGGLGMLAAGVGFVRTIGCTGDEPVFSTAVLVLAVVLCAMAAGAAAILAGGRFSSLAMFGALEVLAFFTQPLGVPILQTASPHGAVIAVIVAACIIGAAVGLVPELTVLLGGVAGGVTSAVGGARWGSICSVPDSSALVALVVFVVMFLLARSLRSIVRR